MSSLSSPSTKLPDLIKIDDITSGKIDPSLIFNELERLKVEINILRNDMSLLVKALATIPPDQSQQEYYRVVVLRLKSVQTSIKDYCAKYNKLLPIINLAQIKLGHEVEIIPQNPTGPSKPTGSRLSVSGPISNGSSGVPPSNGDSVSSSLNGASPLLNGNNNKVKRSNSIHKSNSTNDGTNGGTVNQPIVI